MSGLRAACLFKFGKTSADSKVFEALYWRLKRYCYRCGLIQNHDWGWRLSIQMWWCLVEGYVFQSRFKLNNGLNGLMEGSSYELILLPLVSDLWALWDQFNLHRRHEKSHHLESILFFKPRIIFSHFYDIIILLLYYNFLIVSILLYSIILYCIIIYYIRFSSILFYHIRL